MDSGVYINVFEQSIIIDHPGNKSWSFLASVSVELLIVSMMILIPLAYTDHLPAVHWNTVTIGPPVRPLPPKPQPARAASGPARPDFLRESPIFNPIKSSQNVEPAASGPVTLDAPPAFASNSSDLAAPSSGPIVFEKPLIGTPPENVIKKPSVPSGPIRVSIGVQMAKLVTQVIPVYPPLARSTRISGVVHLVGIIAKDGTIRNLQLISGHPMLTRAALDAVQQWVYKPTLLNGEPVEVICPIDVNFTLSQ